ncbi:hypothetical protein BJX68DRAFT_207718 [Aspergillus pseudodeflectus]|uniref:Uncharacterized protein n=1 Tax=Aspergillus pseudodeflectus TaxID=176178 RepID=A0ABR4KVP8_9EURO
MDPHPSFPLHHTNQGPSNFGRNDTLDTRQLLERPPPLIRCPRSRVNIRRTHFPCRICSQPRFCVLLVSDSGSLVSGVLSAYSVLRMEMEMRVSSRRCSCGQGLMIIGES